jgi:hypothetical protein
VKTLWTEAGRRELETRIARLTQSVLMATGEPPVADRRTPLRFPPPELLAAVKRFVAHGRSGRWARHPAFRPLSAHAWGVLTWRHADHHLRQLGA